MTPLSVLHSKLPLHQELGCMNPVIINALGLPLGDPDFLRVCILL
jgi:hypothetical protein